MIRIFPLYVARSFALWFLSVLGAIAGIVFLFSFVELIRKTSGRPDVGGGILLRMACFQLPQIIGYIMPFVFLFAAMLTSWSMNRSLEFVVARASGFSIWQVFGSFCVTAVAIIVLDFTVLNPMGAVFSQRYEALEKKFIIGKSRDTELSLSAHGLWLRQQKDRGYTIIHAGKVRDTIHKTFEDISIFNFSGTDQFEERIDAAKAELEGVKWRLSQVRRTVMGTLTSDDSDMILKTDFNFGKIQDSFATPKTISVWAMPQFIALIEKAGFSALTHRLHWHRYLSYPLLYLAMIMLALPLTLTLPRRGSVGQLVGSAVLFGFFLYVFSSIMQTLGSSARVPVFIAAWLPSIASALAGVLLLLHVENE